MTKPARTYATDARGTIEVFADAGELATAAAERFVACAAQAVERSGRFAVALAGGSTPRSTYERLATATYAARVDWSRVHAFWCDERCVAPDDPAANYRMAREALLDRVPLPAGHVHRVRGEDDPAAAAAAYESELRAAFDTPHGPPPAAVGKRFDLVLLGMGADGHTASLFPGTAAIGEAHRWVVAHEVAAAPPWRITLTPPVLNAADAVVFLVCGGEKARALRDVLEGPPRPEALPAQVVRPHDGSLAWLVDAAAASELG